MRDLEAPGNLQPGNFDFSFSFKNLDFEVDSYEGIAIAVVFEVKAEMRCQGNLMNYNVGDS
jgi:hypothetical protein